MVVIVPEVYLIVVPLTGLTVPAAGYTFNHFLPFTRTAWDAAYRWRERWVTCSPTHVLDLEKNQRIQKNHALLRDIMHHKYWQSSVEADIAVHEQSFNAQLSLYLQKMCLQGNLESN